MSSPVGFNLIGYLGAAMGLGHSMRLLADVLRRAGHDVVGFDVDGLAGVARTAVPHDIPLVDSVAALPYRYNIVSVALQTLPSLWLRRLPQLGEARFRNAAHIFWELPGVPRALRHAVSAFDAVLCSSGFTRQAIETSVPDVRCLHLEQPLAAGLALCSRHEVRQRHSLPPNDFLFCASFDLFSGVQRKNPQALVDAFIKAFPDDAGVGLVLKCNGDRNLASESPLMTHLFSRIDGDRRIRVLLGTMDYADVMSLYGACDAYLSFHRAEGLGLGPLESMSLGRPAIATGYSGNVEFMNVCNSILLPYRMVPTTGAEWHYSPAFCGKAAQWAEVDVDAAAQAMRRLREDPALCARLGERARRDVAERQAYAWSAAFVPQLLRVLEESDHPSQRDSHIKRLRRAELTDPVLLQRNVSAAFTRLRGGV